MSFIDKNLSQKNGHGPAPESKNINISVENSSQKTRRPKKISVPKSTKQIKKRWRTILSVIGIILILFLGYNYISTKNDLEKLADSKKASQEAKDDLVKKVGKLVDLPINETPSTATVSDASKLQNQEFFVNAKNGDKVLVFAKSGRAVLYRPSTNKVIEFSKVNLSNAQ